MGMDGRRRGHGEPRIIISRRRPGIRAEKLVFVAWALCPRDGLTTLHGIGLIGRFRPRWCVKGGRKRKGKEKKEAIGEKEE